MHTTDTGKNYRSYNISFIVYINENYRKKQLTNEN